MGARQLNDDQDYNGLINQIRIVVREELDDSDYVTRSDVEAEIDARIERAAAELRATKEQVVRDKEKIVALQQSHEQHSARMDSIERNMHDIDSKVESVLSSVVVLKSGQDAQSTTLNTLIHDFKSVQSNIGLLLEMGRNRQDVIKALSERQQGQSKAMAELANDTGQNASDIDDMRIRLSEYTLNVQSGIEKNRAKIENMSTQLNSMHATISVVGKVIEFASSRKGASIIASVLTVLLSGVFDINFAVLTDILRGLLSTTFGG